MGRVTCSHGCHHRHLISPSPGGGQPPLPSSPTSTHSSTHPPRTPPPSPLLHPHTTSTPSAPITEFRSLCCKCVCGQFHCWLGAQWFGCFVRQNHFLKSQKKSKEIAAGHHTSIVFALEEAERFMFGRLKPRIDAKKSFKSERVDTCLLAHTFPLAFLLPPSSSFSADTCSHAHVVISLSPPPPPFPPCPFTLPLFILSIHIAPLRGGGGQPWGGLGLPSSPSHLCPQGVPPLPFLPYIHALIHTPTTNTTTKSPPSFPHDIHSFCTYHRVSFVVL